MQRTLLDRRGLGLGLCLGLLPCLLGDLGRLGCRFGLLAHANQFGFACLLVLDFLFLNLAQLAVTAILFLARFQFFLADDRSACNGALRGLCPRRNGHLGLDYNLCFDDGLDDRLNHGLDDRLDHRFDDGLDFRHCGRNFDRQLGNGLRGMLPGFPLDENALLAHLDLNGPGAPVRIGRLDFRCLLAGQRDLGLRLVTMRPAQVFKQPGLVLVGQRIGAGLLADTGLAQLLEQGRFRHLEFNGELRNSCCSHTCYPPAHSNQ